MINVADVRPRPEPSETTARTEVEVGADVLARMISRGALRGDEVALTAMSKLTSVPVMAVKAALDHQKRFGFRDLRADICGAPRIVAESRPAAPQAPAKPDGSNQSPGQRHAAQRKTARFQQKNPRPGIRVCSDCKRERSIDDFTVKSRNPDGTPLYHYRCDECRSTYQQRRYLSVQAEAELGALVEFVLDHDDGIADAGCPYCPNPLEPGQHVAGRLRLAHAGCLAKQLTVDSELSA